MLSSAKCSSSIYPFKRTREIAFLRAGDTNPCNRYQFEKVRLLRPDVAVVFIRANLTWYLNGKEQHIEARPTLVAEKIEAASGKLPSARTR